jgi:RES domain-containing protein
MARRFEGPAVRALHPRYWEDPFGLGRDEMPAGRFNLAGGRHVLYLGDDFYTCAEEAQIFVVPATPTAFVTVDCRLPRVLDLRLAEVQHALDTCEEELRAPYEHAAEVTPTQALGAALVDSRHFDAAFFPSARRLGHHCTAVFMDVLEPPAALHVGDPQSGPRVMWPR